MAASFIIFHREFPAPSTTALARVLSMMVAVAMFANFASAEPVEDQQGYNCGSGSIGLESVPKDDPVTRETVRQAELLDWTGRRNDRPDMQANAVKILTQMARLGDRRAEFLLALKYRDGDGVEADAAEAERRFDRAARFHAPLFLFGAACFHAGRADPKHTSMESSGHALIGLSLMKMAAELKFIPAMIDLSVLYALDRRSPPDVVAIRRLARDLAIHVRACPKTAAQQFRALSVDADFADLLDQSKMDLLVGNPEVFIEWFQGLSPCTTPRVSKD